MFSLCNDLQGLTYFIVDSLTKTTTHENNSFDQQPYFISFDSIAQPAFAVQAGANLSITGLGHQSSVINNSKTAKIDSDPRLGLLAGLIGEFHIGKFICFRPELNFIQKGYHRDHYALESTQDARTNYLELPANFTLALPSTKGRLFIGAGPAIALGLSGNIKETDIFDYYGNQTIHLKFDGVEPVSDTKRHLKKFEFSLNAIIGYKITSKFFTAFMYTRGLTDNLARKDEYSEWKNSGLALKAGYYFTRNKKN